MDDNIANLDEEARNICLGSMTQAKFAQDLETSTFTNGPVYDMNPCGSIYETR